VFVYQFDKHYNSEATKSAQPRTTVILYAQIGGKQFKTFHDKIVSLISENKSLAVDYILRQNYAPLEKNGSSNKVGLSGYGVELDIKSTEYKANDDVKVETSTDEAGKSAQISDSSEKSLQGFMFDRLQELNPDLKERLDEYRKHLIESTLELAPLKAWQMQDLSLQAAQRIIESSPSEALGVLEDLSQNFPLRARALSSVKVKKDLRKELKSQRGIMETKLNLEPGAGALYLNGLELDINTVDIFALNTLLNKESRLIESLHIIGMDLEQIRDLVYLDTSSKSTDYGVDIRDSSIQWVNDLESDKKYAHWPKSTQDLLRPTYPGMMRSIAKNFFNLVLFVDPKRKESKELLKTVESFYINDVPVRIGFVFVTNGLEETSGFEDASVALFRAHNYVKEKTSSPAKALSFLTDVRLLLAIYIYISFEKKNT
jgi:UDP-glucose:glycoprotein glucosyltransferase